MDHDVLTIIAQFGPAGLIGLLWIAERRHASRHDRQLGETHRRLLERDQDHDVLLSVIKDNARAITLLEATQRQLVDLARGLAIRPATAISNSDS